MTITVDKGVPRRTTEKPRHMRYPWSHMEVGDSFWVPVEYHHRTIQASQVRAKKFSEEYAHDAEMRGRFQGTRFWRIR